MTVAESAKRRIKKVETVRQKAAKAETPKKPRRVKQAATAATGKVKQAGSLGKRQIHIVKLPDNRFGHFFGKSRQFVPKFFREAWAELKLVTWPNRQETFKLTTAVLLF